MTDSIRISLDLTIVATDPPFAVGDGVLFGLQSKHVVDDPVPACATAEFQTAIEVVRSGGEFDFTGRHVHGRRGDRFLYVSWGIPDGAEPFVMFARAKIKLLAIPSGLLDDVIGTGQVLTADLQATDSKGQPATGTITPPAIRWHVH